MTDLTRTLELLDRLVAFPTVSRDSNLELIDFVQHHLQGAGFEVARMPSPDGRKAGLFARIGPKVAGGVCLSAHTDVVPVDGQDWTRPPFVLTQDRSRIYGRGTTDMKGFLASALALAERASAQALATPLSLSISYDEELGCLGIQHMMPQIRALIGAPHAVIVGEPTSMQVATGHKGKTALKVTCHGEAGHSALAPDFLNAVHVAAHFIGQIQRLQTELAEGPQDPAYSIPYATVHIGRIRGGEALNIVPAEAVLDIECRTLAQTPPTELVARIEALAHETRVAFRPELPVRVEVVNAYPGLETDRAAPVVDWAVAMSGKAQATKVPFGTEAGFFAALDLPTVVIGPGDMAADGHKPDEGLAKAELAACDAMMGRILNDLLT